jgi:hypothetical protein
VYVGGLCALLSFVDPNMDKRKKEAVSRDECLKLLSTRSCEMEIAEQFEQYP